MKFGFGLFLFMTSLASYAQTWKTLPKGVRILGYRNVTTSKIDSNFNQFRSESSLGASFKVDAASLSLPQIGMSDEVYNNLVVGEYKVDAQAQAQVHGTGFGYGITDRVMLYTELAYYNVQVNAKIKRTAGNSYSKAADAALANGSNNSSDQLLQESVRAGVDANENTIQSVITNYYEYKPIGNWQGSGYGDMETGLMANVIDRSSWGVLVYPGVILPTGREDDPNILQDMGFGDGQFDLFTEVATGYVYNDYLRMGTTLRYTYQAADSKELRVPTARDFPLSDQTGNFDVKYGDRINWMINGTYSMNDWISVTPLYRFMYQAPSTYDSQFTEANSYLAYNSDKQEHQVQLTTSFSTITPFLKKQFALPAQINVNAVQTVAGKNVPKAARFEVEIRMLF